MNTLIHHYFMIYHNLTLAPFLSSLISFLKLKHLIPVRFIVFLIGPYNSLFHSNYFEYFKF